MTLAQKLHLLLDLSGLTQEELARELGVSFVTLNRWSRGKAIPRSAAATRIDRLLASYLPTHGVTPDPLTAKKAAILASASKSVSVIRTILHRPDILDEFVLRLTFTSNRIEGSTMTEAETAVVLFQNGTVPRRSLVEQLEAKNHQAALLTLFREAAANGPIDEALVLRLHGMLMNGIRDDAGFYRREGVRIVGAEIATANWVKVPELMTTLLSDVQADDEDPIRHAAAIHARFEQIHPFSDGNGRIGRLLIHAMLLRRNLPPVIIRPKRRASYYAALNEAQRTGDSARLEELLCDGILESGRIMTDAEGG